MLTKSVLLLGLESSGKSALFRGLTDSGVGDEANFRGSTVVCRRCRSRHCECDIIDAPGIRAKDDSETSRLALAQIDSADTVVLVARGTHLREEVSILLRELNLADKKSALVITFKDKAAPELDSLAQVYRRELGIPVVVVDARTLPSLARAQVVEAISTALPLPATSAELQLPKTPTRNPALTVFEHPVAGPIAAVFTLLAMFGLPVYAAYQFASWAQGPVDEMIISPLKEQISQLPPLLFELLAGSYGIITLGWYSFLWALPVVLFLGISVALAEESGVKDRLTNALDPILRRIGLTGRDLIPVMAGFGCNVVAVFQTRGCSKCTRRACVSLIAYGSACSYQIGASLSIFSSSGHPGLFLPYLLILFLVGALHTRIWHGALSKDSIRPLHERAFLQRPSVRAIYWRVAATVKQFLLQAMPIFLLICLVAALLQYFGVLARLADIAGPALSAFHLPGVVAPGILFSILRKDGLLVLNENDGAVLQGLTAGQVLLLVYLASTLTACLVTLWTIQRELGWQQAAKVAGRQAATSLASAFLLALAIRIA